MGIYVDLNCGDLDYLHNMFQIRFAELCKIDEMVADSEDDHAKVEAEVNLMDRIAFIMRLTISSASFYRRLEEFRENGGSGPQTNVR